MVEKPKREVHSSMPATPEWSIIVPCYNAAQFIEASLARLLRFVSEAEDDLGPCEIIVIDDGSTDETSKIVASTFPEIALLTWESNRGKGAAVRAGMLESKGRYRFFIDADIPFDLSAFFTMMRYLRDKEFDLCIGRRDTENVEEFAHPNFVRRLASRVFTFVIARVVVTGVSDTQCGMKGFRANAAQYLFGQSHTRGFAFDVEILYLAYKSDLDIKRVPVRLTSSDHSSVSTFREAPRMLFEVLLIPFRYYTGQYTLSSSPLDDVNI